MCKDFAKGTQMFCRAPGELDMGSDTHMQGVREMCSYSISMNINGNDRNGILISYLCSWNSFSHCISKAGTEIVCDHTTFFYAI